MYVLTGARVLCVFSRQVLDTAMHLSIRVFVFAKASSFPSQPQDSLKPVNLEEGSPFEGQFEHGIAS